LDFFCRFKGLFFRMRILKNRKIHNLSLSGITGIIFGMLAFLFVIIIQYMINNYTHADGGLALLPISFFQFIIIGSLLFMLAVLYFTVVISNKKRRKKLNQFGWDLQAKKIRAVLILFLAVLSIVIYFIMNYLNIHYIIPSILLFYGITLISLQKNTTGNSLILGIFMLLNCILTFLFPKTAFMLLGVSLGIYPIIYGLIYC
ncbi:MAG: hypothetical protein ACWA42_05840, partial [Lutibacter sp.]